MPRITRTTRPTSRSIKPVVTEAATETINTFLRRWFRTSRKKAPDLLRLQAEQDEVCIGNCLSVVRSRTDPIFFCDVFRSRFVGRRGKDSVHAGEQESTAAATPRETPS